LFILRSAYINISEKSIELYLLNEMLAMSPMSVGGKCRANVHDLHVAIAADSMKDVRRILSHGINNINQPVKRATALSLALYLANNRVFNTLLDHCNATCGYQLDVDCLSCDHQLRVEPPIVTAARLGNLAAVDRLLDCGADIEATDNIGHSALWVAAQQRQFLVAFELIRRGARVQVSPRASWQPVFASARLASRRTDIARLLILTGADGLNSDGEELLKRFLAPGRLNAVRLLRAAAFFKVDRLSEMDNDYDVALYLRSIVKQPASLQCQCRWEIRRAVSSATLGSHFLPALAQLPLPRRLLDYVALADEVSEWQELLTDFGFNGFPCSSWIDLVYFLMKPFPTRIA
jgi:SOCS box